MNKLSNERKSAILASLVEGNSIRATCRITGVAKGTVSRLLSQVGWACIRFHDETVREVGAERVRCDEIRSFVHCKQRNQTDKHKARLGLDVHGPRSGFQAHYIVGYREPNRKDSLPIHEGPSLQAGWPRSAYHGRAG